MPIFVVETCRKCGKEKRFENMIVTPDPPGAEWMYVRLGSEMPTDGNGFCHECSKALRKEFEKLLALSELAKMPESDADRGPIQ